MSETLLVMEDLCIRSPSRTLVEGVNIEVQAGRVTAVVGHSGSGKSLSARACMAVLDVDPGLVRGSLRYPAASPADLFEGVRGGGMRAQKALLRRTKKYRGGYITYSPQSASSALNPGRTIGAQLAIAVARRENPPKSASHMATIIRDVLEEVGLPPRASGALPGELSGGMAQRAALAIAIAPQPRIMIADEPETGLDPVLRRVVNELMLQVAKDHGVGLMLISHNMDTVRRCADTVVRIGADAPDPQLPDRKEAP
ncbi:MAG: ABC transporter ATP-binding protein [Alphaproteobacteria bacterium]|nr:ABC transporter ATP-binding protein [Alphaproteobacteria bacterium]